MSTVNVTDFMQLAFGITEPSEMELFHRQTDILLTDDTEFCTQLREISRALFTLTGELRVQTFIEFLCRDFSLLKETRKSDVEAKAKPKFSLKTLRALSFEYTPMLKNEILTYIETNVQEFNSFVTRVKIKQAREALFSAVKPKIVLNEVMANNEYSELLTNDQMVVYDAFHESLLREYENQLHDFTVIDHINRLLVNKARELTMTKGAVKNRLSRTYDRFHTMMSSTPPPGVVATSKTLYVTEITDLLEQDLSDLFEPAIVQVLLNNAAGLIVAYINEMFKLKLRWVTSKTHYPLLDALVCLLGDDVAQHTFEDNETTYTLVLAIFNGIFETLNINDWFGEWDYPTAQMAGRRLVLINQGDYRIHAYHRAVDRGDESINFIEHIEVILPY
jgi:hypothetical protein